MQHSGRTGSITRTGRRLTAALAAGAIVTLTTITTAPAAPAAPAATKPSTKPSTASVVSSETVAGRGTVLAARTTVYTLKTNGGGCAAKCLTARPPVLLSHGVRTPTAGPGVDAQALGTARATHHARQITYAGKRLYWSIKDTAPGQAHGSGHDKWGTWSTVALAAGAPTATAAPTSDAQTNDGPTTAPTVTAPTVGPSTAPTVTAPTVGPATAPAATSPPETDPPATSPPTPAPTTPTTPTKNPGTGGAAF